MALVTIFGEEGSRVEDESVVVIEGVLLGAGVSYSVIIIVAGLLFLDRFIYYDQQMWYNAVACRWDTGGELTIDSRTLRICKAAPQHRI